MGRMQSLTEFQRLLDPKSMIVIYSAEQVRFVLAEDFDPEQVEDDILEIRAFDEKKEIKIVFDEETGELTRPFVKDEEYEKDKDYYDEDMFVLGSNHNLDGGIVSQDGKTILTDQKKKVILPISFTEEEIRKGIVFRVRNYFALDSHGIPYVKSYRYVGFHVWEDKNK